MHVEYLLINLPIITVNTFFCSIVAMLSCDDYQVSNTQNTAVL